MKIQKTSREKNLSKFFMNKTLVGFIVFIFTYTQVLPISFALPPDQYASPTEVNNPVKPVDDVTSVPPPPPVQASSVNTASTEEFLRDELSLEKSTVEVEENASSAPAPDSQTQAKDNNAPAASPDASQAPAAAPASTNPFQEAFDRLFNQAKDIAVSVVENVQSFTL